MGIHWIGIYLFPHLVYCSKPGIDTVRGSRMDDISLEISD